ncbi:MAG TPA: GTPase ObgE [Candidatus Omnitrophota bacterium]|nr:GTPase ObgE [Candidatus Omnitrophota bacterium]HPD83988.1 GTPase ObgE [Candidatus Omnitrophota bacterium]HRZ02845.1 GTPase ObgE [Candidatus Omnitrophota bacterium]
MIFVDEARIYLKAGDGGKGCESHYSDMRTRYPRPDGGDGGKGGDIVFIADKNIQTLLDFKFKQHYKGEKGHIGSSKGSQGRRGTDCVLKVPVGTLIRDDANGLLIKDLVSHGQQVIAVRGGRGGRGNNHNRVPAPAEEGESRVVRLELKLIADVGIVGFPNVGKSTFISNVSRVKSKIANYPFTTRQPILGIVQGEDFDFAIADLPGLIEGAHKGRGLGDRFLKHTERTRILLHMIDMSGSEGRDPLDDYEKINNELAQYSDTLLFKNRIIAANKMDLPEAKENLKRFKKKYKGKIYPISALNKEGIEKLIDAIRVILCRENSKKPSDA